MYSNPQMVISLILMRTILFRNSKYPTIIHYIFSQLSFTVRRSMETHKLYSIIKIIKKYYSIQNRQF